METLYAVFLFVFGILSIILFFKVWGMCNNVKSIKSILTQLSRDNQAKPIPNAESTASQGSSKFAVNQLVIIKENEKLFRIANVIKCDDGNYSYADKNDNRYSEQQLEDFEEYWAARK